ncbi:MAG: hypothetical protein ACRC8S_12670 [Fimbriiglobus sp.]
MKAFKLDTPQRLNTASEFSTLEWRFNSPDTVVSSGERVQFDLQAALGRLTDIGEVASDWLWSFQHQQQRDSLVRQAGQGLRQVVLAPFGSRLLNDKKKWLRIIASLDAIGDTDMAIESYRNIATDNLDFGKLYLSIYGLLQAVFVQINAVKDLAEDIGMYLVIPNSLDEIRKIRNNSIGHGASNMFGVVRATMKHSEFRLHNFDMNSKKPSLTISVVDLINVNSREISSIIYDLIDHLHNTAE